MPKFPISVHWSCLGCICTKKQQFGIFKKICLESNCSITCKKLIVIKIKLYDEMPPVNTSLRSLCKRNCFRTITSFSKTGKRLLYDLISSADLTPLLILKLISTLISVSLSVSFTMGTLALSNTFMEDGAAMFWSQSARSRVRKGSSFQIPITTKSMSLKHISMFYIFRIEETFRGMQIVVIYLVGRYSPVRKLPKTSTFESGHIPVMTLSILFTTRNLISCSASVGLTYTKKSSISSCKLKANYNVLCER